MILVTYNITFMFHIELVLQVSMYHIIPGNSIIIILYEICRIVYVICELMGSAGKWNAMAQSEDLCIFSIVIIIIIICIITMVVIIVIINIIIIIINSF